MSIVRCAHSVLFTCSFLRPIDMAAGSLADASQTIAAERQRCIGEKMYKKWPCINFTISSTPFIHPTVFLQSIINKVGTTCSGFHSKPTTRRPHELFSSVKNAARLHSKAHALLDCFSLRSKHAIPMREKEREGNS